MLPLLVLYSSMLPLPLLYSSGHATLLVMFMHSLLPPSQTTTEPPAPVLPLAPSPSGPPSQLVPLDEPQPGPSGLHRPARLVSAHIEHIDGSFPSSFSLFIRFDQLSFYYICISTLVSVSSVPFTWVRWYVSVFPFPRSLGGQEGCYLYILCNLYVTVPFSFIVFCSVNNISGVLSYPFVLLGCVLRTFY